jgi:hypothetical protein
MEKKQTPQVVLCQKEVMVVINHPRHLLYSRGHKPLRITNLEEIAMATYFGEPYEAQDEIAPQIEKWPFSWSTKT